MTARQHFSITLPLDLAEAVAAKIKAGAYQSASEVVHEGLLVLLDRDASIDQWLRDDVVAGHGEYLADPSTGVAADDLLGRIKTRRACSDRVANDRF